MRPRDSVSRGECSQFGGPQLAGPPWALRHPQRNPQRLKHNLSPLPLTPPKYRVTGYTPYGCNPDPSAAHTRVARRRPSRRARVGLSGCTPLYSQLSLSPTRGRALHCCRADASGDSDAPVSAVAKAKPNADTRARRRGPQPPGARTHCPRTYSSFGAPINPRLSSSQTAVPVAGLSHGSAHESEGPRVAYGFSAPRRRGTRERAIRREAAA